MASSMQATAESDILKYFFPFDFTAPDAPMDIVVESIKDFRLSLEPNEDLRP